VTHLTGAPEFAMVPLPPTTQPEPIDVVSLLDRCMSDSAFAVEMLGLFAGQTPTLLAEVEAALAAGDTVKTAKAAHAIKGSAANMSAEAVRAAALRVEELGKAGDLAGACAAVIRLQAEVRQCLEYVPTLVALLKSKG
jgi:HPt (histidine-containing phosphotransfer) domain-containing protein